MKMKKLIIVMGICFLLVGMPTMTANPTEKIRHTRTIFPATSTVSRDNDASSDLILYNFSGVWGLTLLGVPLPPTGWVEGYFTNRPGFGRLEAGFAEFNVTNATGQIGGFMLWVFFIGGVQSVETGNGTYVAGIGTYNVTHFYWKLNAIIGPNYYINCEYSKFEE
jgi:hypothetical protein